MDHLVTHVQEVLLGADPIHTVYRLHHCLIVPAGCCSRNLARAEGELVSQAAAEVF